MTDNFYYEYITNGWNQLFHNEWAFPAPHVAPKKCKPVAVGEQPLQHMQHSVKLVHKFSMPTRPYNYIPEIWKFRWYYGFGCAAAVSAAAVSAAAARQRLYRP